jgi:hypothetical protein
MNIRIHSSQSKIGLSGLTGGFNANSVTIIRQITVHFKDVESERRGKSAHARGAGLLFQY